MNFNLNSEKLQCGNGIMSIKHIIVSVVFVIRIKIFDGGRANRFALRCYYSLLIFCFRRAIFFVPIPMLLDRVHQ